MLNSSAITVARLLLTGEGDPLSPKYQPLMAAAFPLRLDEWCRVSVNGDASQLAALGYIEGRLCLVWASEDGPGGWYVLPPPTPPRLTWWQRFRRWIGR